MRNVSLQGRSKELPSTSPVATTATQRPVATPLHPTAARSGSIALEVKGQESNLGFTAHNVRHSQTRSALSEQAHKLRNKAIPYPSKHGFSEVELNRRVQVGPSTVACGLLATLFATYSGKKSAS